MTSSSYNICLIDDDRIYQFTAKKILESTGLIKDIKAFYNGEDAIAFLKEHLNDAVIFPDIIFLDINMPVMDGWQFLDAFTDLYNSLPKPVTIYMVSSSVDDYDIRKSKEYVSVTDYIIKPINKERFQQLINTATKG